MADLVNSLFGLSPKVLAQQLTIRDLEVMKGVSIKEFQGSNAEVAWMKPNKAELSPNIIKTITHTNNVSFWVASEVLNQADIARRAATIEYFISLLEELYALNSFNSFAAIVHGIRHGSIDRLKKTWAMVSPSTIKTWESLNPFIDQYARFDKYNARAFELSNTPFLPFLGVILHKVHDMEKGTKDSPAKRANIDNAANEVLAQIAAAAKHFSQTLKPVDEIQSYLREVPILSAKAVYERSLELEPRQRQQQEPGEGETDLKASSDSLTSSPAFFWGVPALALAAVAVTAVFLYRRQTK